MEKFLPIKIVIGLVTISLFGCGGGGDSGSSPSSASSSPNRTPSVSLSTPPGTPCLTSTNSTDVFGSTKYTTFSTINASTWGCQIVNKSDGQPVFDGNQSLRFEVRPGDCNANSGWSDCANDRSRWELMSSDNHGASTQGKIITYQYYVYVPYQPQILPPTRADVRDRTAQTLLSQLNWYSRTDTNAATSHSIMAGLYVNDSGGFYVLTNKDFGYTPNQKILIDSNPYDKWIKMTYVVKSTTAADGYIKIYANDKLVVDETRATLPNTDCTTVITVGFYNTFLSVTSLAWQTQVAYFDGMSTTVTSF
jgi:Polysaccharide lyase